ncbi:MAG: hypothetical protein JWN84_2495 [Nocardioides sp.]|nr:hypothetical protein [Nocardioides sp.]
MTTPPRASAAVVVLLALLVAGCSDDTPATGETTPSPSTSSTGAAASEPTSQPTSEPTSEPAAATGPRLVLGTLSLRAPEGWTKVASQSPFDVAARGGDGVQGDQVQLVTFPVVSGGSTLEQIAAESARALTSAEVLEPVEVGGVLMAHVRGVAGGVLTDTYVADVGGDQVSISFGYDNAVEGDRAFQQALMDEVLATAAWSG